MQEDRLSAVLRDFARTLGTDFAVQSILEHLVARIVEVLPLSGAGVTLLVPGVAPHPVAASNEAALHLERLQADLREGPSLLAYSTGKPVEVPDLVADDRFPRFGPAALARGTAAVSTFPLLRGEGRLGALDLYRNSPGELDAPGLAAAETLADVASAYLLNAQAREEALRVSDRFRHQALHDALTGLPNRVLLQERIAHAALRAQRSHSQAAVLFADLDRFKRVNDTHGHAIGDELLVAVAHRLAALVRPGDTLARVSGDEFVVLCEDLTDVTDVELLANRIERAFEQAFVLSSASVKLSASVGVAYGGPGEAITPQLVADADTAMYQAKRSGGGVHRVIDLQAARRACDRDQLEQDLRSAARRGQLDLAYQPIVRTGHGLVTGVEALLRWTHPVHGPVSTLTAVSLAEQSDLIEQIGAWVLERACRDRVRWLAEHPHQPLDLSVNISSRQLGSDLVATVAAVLDRTGMEPSALVLEVTESIFIDDSDRPLGVLADLRALGVRIALDDFGSGYCSLGYLRRFRVDALKIDQTFVANIHDDPTATAIVGAVSDLAHGLGMDVTAEGVETEQQRYSIERLGCDQAQGFLYARPMSCSSIATLLAATRRGALRLPATACDQPHGRHADVPLTRRGSRNCRPASTGRS